MMNPLKWFKQLFYIVRTYESARFHDNNINLQRQQSVDRRIEALRRQMQETNDLMKERTEVHADIAFNKADHSTIIVIGRYNGHDFIQSYRIHSKSTFDYLLRNLMHESKYGIIGKVDAPPVFTHYAKHHDLFKF